MDILGQVSALAIRTSQEILLPNFARVKSQTKDDGSWLTIADTLAHETLLKELPMIANYPVLSEELTELEQEDILKKQDSSYWCIDPLDGTSNFTQGIPYWCMSIALIIDGILELGVVYDPNRDECFAASSTTVTTLNGKPIIAASSNQIASLDSAMGLIDFKRLDASLKIKLVELQPYRSQRSFGASALDFCWIAANRCQIYLHGKQKLWDYSAGLVILNQAEGRSQTISGDVIFQNELQPKSVIAASNENLFEQWTDVIASMNET